MKGPTLRLMSYEYMESLLLITFHASTHDSMHDIRDTVSNH